MVLQFIIHRTNIPGNQLQVHDDDVFPQVNGAEADYEYEDITLERVCSFYGCYQNTS